MDGLVRGRGEGEAFLLESKVKVKRDKKEASGRGAANQ